SRIRACAHPRILFGNVRDEGDRAETLEGAGELALMTRAIPGDAARDDLAALRHEGAEALDVTVVDRQDLVDAELAHLASAEPTPLHGLDHLFASLFFASPPACGAPCSADTQKGTSSVPPAASSTGSASAGTAPPPPPRPRPRNCSRSATTSTTFRFCPS